MIQTSYCRLHNVIPLRVHIGFVYIVLRIPGPEMAEKKECKSPEYFREVFQVGAASIQVLIKQELLLVYMLSGLMRTL